MMREPATTPTILSDPAVVSDRLRIRVTDGGRVKIDVTMAARAAAELPALVPDHLRRKLDQASIDLEALARQVTAGGFQPGELFLLDDGFEAMRVWLE